MIYLIYTILLCAIAFTLFPLVILQRRKIILLATEKRNIENNLQEQQNSFKTIFDRSQYGIAIINLDGHILKVNKSWCELFGYDESDMLAMNYFYFINRVDLNNLQNNTQHLNNSINIYQSEHECFAKNGDSLWILSTLSLIRDTAEKARHFIVQIENITSKKLTQDRVHHMAFHDPLTGLANRNKLEQFINHLLINAQRKQQSFALLFLDLDGFKHVNDTIGHDAGDLLLQIIAERLKNAVRATDMVARLGGDEFVVLVTDVKKADLVAIIAQKILENVMQAIIIKGHDIYITTSVGISIYPNDGENLQTLMNDADMALYRAKEKGKNNYQFYTHEMTIKAKEKMNIKHALSQALDKNEFYLHYQPKMEISTRRITGVEALLRWKNENFRGIKPDEIIALAEESGLIIPFSEWILKNACMQLKKWHDMGWTSLTMAVNCTSRQFKQVTFIDNLKSIISEIDFPPALLEIEITERMIMKDTENTLRILEQIKEMGLKIVIDDFGTGYWSIGNLRNLSVDKIKIDRTFIKHIVDDKTSFEIAAAIIAMVNKLGVTSIAEGVETHEQYKLLVEEGCCEIQGYYLSHPLDAGALTAFLQHPVPESEVTTIESETA